MSSRGLSPVRALLVAAVPLVLSAGCCVATSYPARMADVRGAMARGDPERARKDLCRKDPAARNRMLHLCEMGAVCQAMGDYEGSNRALLEGVGIGRDYDERARVSLRDGAAFAAALVLNDRTLPYRGAPFERVMMHTYLALNFTLLHNLEDARVEIRQAYAQQKEMLEDHEKRIARTKEEAAQRSVNMDEVMEKVGRSFGRQRDLLKKAGNVYQNAFTCYLSAVVYELNGDANDAYIDYKTVHDLNPDFRPVWTDLLRCSKKLGFADDYARWRERFGSDVPDGAPAGYGEIVFVHQSGLAPVKREVQFLAPIPVKRKIHPIWIAFPAYESQTGFLREARLRVDGSDMGAAVPLVDLEATAVQDLWDEAPEIALRAILRAAGRFVVSDAAQRKNGPLGFLVMYLAGAVVDRADLRSWLTLPRDIQVLRVSVPAGAHRIDLDLLGDGLRGNAVSLENVPVREGGLTLVNLRSVGAHGKADCVSF